jgi:hypothetical protein
MGLGESVGPKADGTGSARCPFPERHKHGDENKSFAVKLNSRTGHYYGQCYATCGTFDDVELIKRHFNLAAFGDALGKYCELAGVDSAELPPDWDACVSALSNAKLKEIAAWRLYSPEFLSRFKKERRIGWYKGNVAFPVIDDTGKLVAIHCCRLHSKKWFYQPKGQKVWPFIIGELAGPGYVVAAESTWDGLAYLDKSGETGGVIISRGKEFGSRTAAVLEPGKTVYALMQHDEECEHWLQGLCVPGKLTVKAVRFPEKFNGVEKIHDLNDLTRAGATPDDLWRALMAAEIVATPALQNNGASPTDTGESSGSNGTVDLGSEVSPRVEIVEPEDAEEPEKPPPKFPIERLSPLLRDIAKATSDSIGTPIEMCAPIALFAFGGCQGKGVRLESVRGHAPTPGNLFGIISKVSGSGGSETAKRIMGPMIAMQQTLRREFNENERPVIEAEIDNVSAQIDQLKTQLKKEIEPNVRNERKTKLTSLKAELQKLKERESKVLYVTNTTPQALTQLLAAHGDTVMHYEPDSGSALAIIAGQGGDQNTTEILPFEVWLKGFSLEPIENWRVSSGNLSVDEPCISMLFLATPDKVRALFRDSRLVDGGLLSRCLTADPHAKPRRWENPEEKNASSTLSTEGWRRDVYERWESAIFAVINRYFLHKGTQENGQPEYYEVKMTPEARRADIEAWNKFCDEYGDGKEHLFESRYCELALRVALGLHVSRCIRQEKDADGKWHSEVNAHEKPLDKQSMEDALAIIRDFFVPHQKEFLKIEQGKTEEKAWQIARRMMAERPKVGISKRDLYHNHKVCNTEDEAAQFLAQWEREGQIERVMHHPTAKGGRPAKTYRLAAFNRLQN